MNTINRSYVMRGQEVHVRELADVVAVRDAHAAKLDAATLGEAVPQIRKFESAGYAFVPPTEADPGSKVYLKGNDRVMLGTDRLSVHFDESQKSDDVAAWLKQHGFTITERPKFANNLFVVQVPAGHDPLEAARQLTANPKVLFAEPELIESLGGR